MSAANSVGVWVEDAVGERYCVSFSRLEYEKSAVKHARWWVGYMRGGRRPRFGDRPGPAYPCRVVVERYHDPSQR